MSRSFIAPVPEEWCHSLKICLTTGPRKPAQLQAIGDLPGHRQSPSPAEACTVLHRTSILGPRVCAKVWTRQYVPLPGETPSQITPQMPYKRPYDHAACAGPGGLHYQLAPRVPFRNVRSGQLPSWDAPPHLLKLIGSWIRGGKILLQTCPDCLLSPLLSCFLLLFLSLPSS